MKDGSRKCEVSQATLVRPVSGTLSLIRESSHEGQSQHSARATLNPRHLASLSDLRSLLPRLTVGPCKCLFLLLLTVLGGDCTF